MSKSLLPDDVPLLTTAEILLVDDNLIQASTRQAILSRAGLSVSVANQPGAALAMISRPDLSHSVRLVITDHLMPEMNGPKFVARVREVLPQIPVLVLSGMPDAEQEYFGFDVAFHLKPFPPEELIRLARTLMADPELRSA